MGNYCKIDVSGNLLYIEAACNLECFFDIINTNDAEDYSNQDICIEIVSENDCSSCSSNNNNDKREIVYIHNDCCTPIVAFALQSLRNSAPKIPLEILRCWEKRQYFS